MPPAFSLSFSVSISVKTVNWLNGSQGISRAAMFRKSRMRKAQREAARLAVGSKVRAMGLGVSAWLPIEVNIRRVAPSNGLDDDGLRSALKSVRDGVADAFGIGDNTPAIAWRYAHRRGKPREYGVEIFVRSLGVDVLD